MLKEKFDIALSRIGDEIDKDQKEQDEMQFSWTWKIYNLFPCWSVLTFKCSSYQFYLISHTDIYRFTPISLSMSHLSRYQQAANYTNPVSRHPHTLPAYTCAQYCLLLGNRLVMKIFLVAWSYGHCWKLSENENVIRLY